MSELSMLDKARALAAAENTMDLRECMPAILRSLPDDLIRIIAVGYMQASLRQLVEAYELEIAHQGAVPDA